MRQYINEKMPYFFGYCDTILDKDMIAGLLEDAEDIKADGFYFLPVYCDVKKNDQSEGGYWWRFYAVRRHSLVPLAVNVWSRTAHGGTARLLIDAYFKSFGYHNVAACLYNLPDWPTPLDDEGILKNLPY